MAISGDRFLKVTKAKALRISRHAMDRMNQRVGVHPTRGLAAVLFNRSRQVKAPEMFMMGYRPSYGTRMACGERSWYFRFNFFAEELIAVIGEGDAQDEYIWLTTYAPDAQLEHYRLTGKEAAAEPEQGHDGERTGLGRLAIGRAVN